MRPLSPNWNISPAVVQATKLIKQNNEVADKTGEYVRVNQEKKEEKKNRKPLVNME